MRILSVFVLAGMLALLTATGAQADNSGNVRLGPFASTSPDGGTCGGPWANDAFDRVFTVHDNGDGTFRLKEEFRNGTFVTTGPASPGACEATDHHGLTVQAGVVGSFNGFLMGTVSGGTFNPGACDVTPAACSASTTGFVTAVFGPGATLATATFNFEYSSSDQSLAYHHWQDKSDGATEQFVGDIANQ